MLKITKPTLVLDKPRAIRNIEKIQSKINGTDTVIRPHFKTHQSIEIGEWYKNYGVDRITVSSFDMAEYFAPHWNNITVAFPVNILEIDRINVLAEKIQLNIIVINHEAIEFLSQHLKHKVGVFVKIDVGTHRTGLHPDHKEAIGLLLEGIDQVSTLDFLGFLGHAGHSYRSRSHEEILAVYQHSVEIMQSLRNTFQTQYPNLIISLGDTPTCSVVQDFTGVDEIRLGNYIYYDLTMTQITACTTDEIAVALACPITALHEDRNECIVHGGGVHFSKDHMTIGNKTIYGQVVASGPTGFEHIVEGMYVKALSQEHGKIHIPDDKIGTYKVGDVLYIYPVHSCMTANLMKEVWTIDGERIPMMHCYRKL